MRGMRDGRGEGMRGMKDGRGEGMRGRGMGGVRGWCGVWSIIHIRNWVLVKSL